MNECFNVQLKVAVLASTCFAKVRSISLSGVKTTVCRTVLCEVP